MRSTGLKLPVRRMGEQVQGVGSDVRSELGRGADRIQKVNRLTFVSAARNLGLDRLRPA